MNKTGNMPGKPVRVVKGDMHLLLGTVVLAIKFFQDARLRHA